MSTSIGEDCSSSVRGHIVVPFEVHSSSSVVVPCVRLVQRKAGYRPGAFVSRQAVVSRTGSVSLYYWGTPYYCPYWFLITDLLAKCHSCGSGEDLSNPLSGH